MGNRFDPFGIVRQNPEHFNDGFPQISAIYGLGGQCTLGCISFPSATTQTPIADNTLRARTVCALDGRLFANFVQDGGVLPGFEKIKSVVPYVCDSKCGDIGVQAWIDGAVRVQEQSLKSRAAGQAFV